MNNMHNNPLHLKNLTLGQIIGLGFSLVSTLFLIVIAAYQWTLSSSIDDYRQLLTIHEAKKNLYLQIDFHIAEAREAVQAFLGHKDQRQIKIGKTRIERALIDAAALDKFPNNNNNNNHHSKRITYLITLYQNAFNNMVAAHETQGLNHRLGLQKAFRDSALQLEELAGAYQAQGVENAYRLEKEILFLRRWEKDYLLRGQKTYIAKVQDAIQDIHRTINTLAAHNDLDDKTIHTLLNNYRLDFLALVKQDQHIRTTIRRMNLVVKQIRPNLEQRINAANQSMKETRAKVEQRSDRNSLLILVAVALAVLLGLLVTLHIIRRVTQQHRSLENREAQIRFFVKNTPVAAAMFDTEMRYLQVSGRWLDNHNLDPASTIGASHFDLMPNLHPRWKEIFENAQQGAWGKNEAERFEDAKGRTTWVRWEAIPWRNGDNAVAGVIVFSEDVTGRKEIEEEISQHRDRLYFERQLIEKIVLRMRESPEFDQEDIRYLIAPVEETAGDMLLSSRRSDGVRHLFLGDFTGHGLPAAIGGPLVDDLFYRMTKDNAAPGEILKAINEIIYNKLPTGIFLAGGFLEIDPTTMTVNAWNLGLPDILIIRNGAIIERTASDQLALGIMQGENYAKPSLSLQAQREDCFYLYSDGVVESMDPEGEMFGHDALEAILIQIIERGEPLEILQKVLNAYRSGSDQEDDITVVEASI